ncbi:tetratricopeptide repeat protein [Duganella callida]|uniref:Tetratricopeptide repeat protein n=1 Tax=Duganella callida TaxID=2561932 RepID=A0A4Y9SN21_9BURK|nr:tetratricopeptide repeat protein [Duganella callida]TFW24045.1 tetratricopeptide repeat protein [Duganella callida]
MSEPLPFLARLGLNDDADERAVRRAYAKELKQVDQEADPAGFQSLREAYDTALQWLRHRAMARAHAAAAAQAPSELSDATGGGLDVDAAAPSAASAGSAAWHPPATAGPGTAVNPDALGAQPEVDLDALGAAVFADFQRRCQSIVTERPALADAPWQRELRFSLDDPRLINIRARDIFERHVAMLLVDGWQAGHEALLVAAVKVFGWSQDRRRVLSLGRAGGLLDAAIDERATFDLQADELRDAQARLIARLRDDRPPGTRELVADSSLLELLIARYPHWLALITSAPNIVRWRALNAALPGWKRTLSLTRERRSQPARRGGAGVNWVWLLLMGLIFLGRLLSHSGGDAGGSTAPPAAKPGQSYTQQASEQLSQGNTRAAIGQLDLAIRRDPRDHAAYALRAIAHLWNDDAARAQKDLDAAAAINPSTALLFRARGLLEYDQKQYVAAIASFTRSLEMEPDHSFTRLRRAYVYTDDGDYDQALADLTRLIRDDPAMAFPVDRQRIEIAVRQDRRADAVKQAETLLAAYPRNSYAYVFVAQMYRQWQQPRTARAIADRGVAAAPDADLYLYRAQLRPAAEQDGRRQDLAQAVALSKQPSLSTVHQLVRLDLQSRDYHQATVALDKALDNAHGDGERSGLLTLRAIVHSKAGAAAVAQDDYTRARALATTAGQLNNYCWELATWNVNLPAALSACEAALALRPTDAYALDSKAFVLLRLQRYREARAAYDQALAQRPDLPASLFGRGLARLRLGDSTGGQADLRAARTRDAGVDAEFAAMGIKAD